MARTKIIQGGYIEIEGLTDLYMFDAWLTPELNHHYPGPWFADERPNDRWYLWTHDPDNSKKIYLHRILARCCGIIKDINDPRDIDHKDGNTLNNHSNNLRAVSRTVNNRNSDHHRNGGVSFDKRRNKWRAYISVDNVQQWIGYFITEQEAREARTNYVKELE